MSGIHNHVKFQYKLMLIRSCFYVFGPDFIRTISGKNKKGTDENADPFWNEAMVLNFKFMMFMIKTITQFLNIRIFHKFIKCCYTIDQSTWCDFNDTIGNCIHKLMIMR